MSENSRLIIEAIIVTIALSTLGAAGLYAFVLSRRNSPSAIMSMTKTLTAFSERLAVLEKERERDHAGMLRLQLRVAELEIGVKVLIAQIQRLGETPEWNIGAAPPPEVNEVIDTVSLQRSLVALFDVDGLDDLAFQLGIDPGDVAGKTLNARARGLVIYCKQRKMLPELIRLARQLRPDGEI
jgi:hypothetical protein